MILPQAGRESDSAQDMDLTPIPSPQKRIYPFNLCDYSPPVPPADPISSITASEVKEIEKVADAGTQHMELGDFSFDGASNDTDTGLEEGEISEVANSDSIVNGV